MDPTLERLNFECDTLTTGSLRSKNVNMTSGLVVIEQEDSPGLNTLWVDSASAVPMFTDSAGVDHPLDGSETIVSTSNLQTTLAAGNDAAGLAIVNVSSMNSDVATTATVAINLGYNARPINTGRGLVIIGSGDEFVYGAYAVASAAAVCPIAIGGVDIAAYTGAHARNGGVAIGCGTNNGSMNDAGFRMGYGPSAQRYCVAIGSIFNEGFAASSGSTGYYNVLIGTSKTANDNSRSNLIAIGANNILDGGDVAVVIGAYNSTLQSTVCIGSNSTVKDQSVAIGSSNSSNYEGVTIVGNNCSITTSSGTIIGSDNTMGGSYSGVIIGSDNATAGLTVCIGNQLTLENANDVAINVSGTSTPSFLTNNQVLTAGAPTPGEISLPTAVGFLRVLINNVSYDIPLCNAVV